MIFRIVHRVLLLLGSMLAFHRLHLQFGIFSALLFWTIATAIACMLGGLLLYTSPLGRVNWKNHIAAYLIPWGTGCNAGKLWPIILISWVVWLLIGATTSILFPPCEVLPEMNLTLSQKTIRVLLLVSWIADGAGVFHMMGLLTNRFDRKSRTSQTQIKVLLSLFMMITGGLILFLNGFELLAVLVAGGPPFLLCLWYGSFIGIVLIFGRNTRWN
jgi:hypothetical protein